MTILQGVQMAGAILAILVIPAAVIIFIMRLDGRVTLITALFGGFEKRFERMESAVEQIRAATQQAVSPAPRRAAGRGRRDR